MSADVRRMAKKLRTFYCGHSGHVTADMSADLSAGVRWYVRRCPQIQNVRSVRRFFDKNRGHLRPCPLQTMGVPGLLPRLKFEDKEKKKYVNFLCTEIYLILWLNYCLSFIYGALHCITRFKYVVMKRHVRDMKRHLTIALFNDLLDFPFILNWIAKFLNISKNLLIC